MYLLIVFIHSQVALLALQIERPDTMYLNLSASQVKQLMLYTRDFPTALVLARAYGLNEISEWISYVELRATNIKRESSLWNH